MIIDFDPTALGRPLTLQELEALADGKAQVRTRYHDTSPKSYRLTEKEHELFEQTKINGIVINKPKRVAWLAQWWLETTGQPIIRVQSRGKQACVSMDLISCSRENSNSWAGTEDRTTTDTTQNAYAAKRYEAWERKRKTPIPLPENTRRLDQALIRQLAETCIRDGFDDVVRWNGALWQYDGLRYIQISRDSLKYDVWPRLVRATNSQVNKILREIIELLPEVKGEAPQWISHQNGDPEADRLIVRANEIFDIYEREAYPTTSRLFVRGRGAYDLVSALALAAGAQPRGWFYFGIYTSIERIPVEKAYAFASELRNLYWTVIGKKPCLSG